MARAARVADVGLVMGGAFVLVVWFNLYYHYGWTGDRQFSGSLYAVLYYGPPLTLAVLLFASLRLTPNQRVNLFVVLVTSSASVGGLELFAESRYSALSAATRPLMTRLADSKNKTRDAAALAREWGVAIDTRSADEVIAALRKEGVDALPFISPGNNLFIPQRNGNVESAIHVDGQEVMPLAGISNTVTLLCNENGEFVRYRSDQRGFNNSNEMWQLDHLDIAALGDSFTHGYCVSPDQDFVALIRRRYPATLNLGIAGDGPLLMLATLKEYVPRFKPKVVLWFYFEGNDLTDLQTERRSALLRSYLTDGFTQQGAFARQSDIDRAMMHEIPRLENLEEERRVKRQENKMMGRLVDLTKLVMLRQALGLTGGMGVNDSEILDDLSGPNMDAFRDVLLKAKMRVQGWGGELILVYLPEWARYTTYTSWGKAKRGEVLNLAGGLGIPVIDIDPVFTANGDPLSLFPFRAQGHYNEIGHRLVAQEVLKVLSQAHQLQ